MAEPNQDQSEKTEQPTLYKLREARKQGNVAKSTEVNTAFAIVAGLVLLLSIGDIFIYNVLKLCRDMLAVSAEISWSVTSAQVNLGTWMMGAMEALSPVVVLLMLVGVIASFVQIGAVFSLHPLQPKLSRLNPITGFKNKFSRRFLWDIVKTLVKFIALSVITYITVVQLLPSVMAYSSVAVPGIMADFIESSSILLARLAAALIIIAILDVLYTRWEYVRKLRMSKRELKDEIKRRDGDPDVRARRRELESELRKRSSSIGRVPDADVVITNPTHFAIALEFDRSTMLAPQIIGMGSGPMATLMREKAVGHRVPIVSMPRLARRLFKIGRIDQVVPEECYLGVAKALRQAYALNGRLSEAVTS